MVTWSGNRQMEKERWYCSDWWSEMGDRAGKILYRIDDDCSYPCKSEKCKWHFGTDFHRNNIICLTEWRNNGILCACVGLISCQLEQIFRFSNYGKKKKNIERMSKGCDERCQETTSCFHSASFLFLTWMKFNSADPFRIVIRSELWMLMCRNVCCGIAVY